jgi:hypothetical protein
MLSLLIGVGVSFPAMVVVALALVPWQLPPREEV